MEYYIMTKADDLYKEAMAKHGLASCVSPMIQDIVFTIVEKMEKEHLAEIKKLQDYILNQQSKINPPKILRSQLPEMASYATGCPPSEK